ncbi:hypothetical protein [Stigmatella erecta]|uniref:Uncharacterized protein n=1 Tax=Stigmatella erecta TaxID=83460 RepID=A0A1I0FLW6_9BACT|nr:hypothetical protein [Stigmatella erecta]SET59221.1 hypothetical protein SAMN05443639_103468 [Stigmatella erecta]
MMHGSSDVNASLSTTMRMADALIRAGKHFEMLIMPVFSVRALGGPR